MESKLLRNEAEPIKGTWYLLEYNLISIYMWMRNRRQFGMLSKHSDTMQGNLEALLLRAKGRGLAFGNIAILEAVCACCLMMSILKCLYLPARTSQWVPLTTVSAVSRSKPCVSNSKMHHFGGFIPTPSMGGIEHLRHVWGNLQILVCKVIWLLHFS